MPFKQCQSFILYCNNGNADVFLVFSSQKVAFSKLHSLQIYILLFYVFIHTEFTGGFMALILPETLGSTLPDTFEVNHKGSYSTSTQKTPSKPKYTVFRECSDLKYGLLPRISNQ